MGKINNTLQYPFDTKITEKDFLIGTDGDVGNKRTKNFPIGEVAKFIKSINDVETLSGSWVYKCSGDTQDEGYFETPSICYNGNDDPNIASLTSITFSNKTVEGVDAQRLLALAGNTGVMLFLTSSEDLNNFFVIKDPSIGVSPSGADVTVINFTDSYYSKSFKQGVTYNVSVFFTSSFIPDLYKETNTDHTDDPTSPPDGGVHIGKNGKFKVLADKVVVDDENIFFTGDMFTGAGAIPPDTSAMNILLAVAPVTGKVMAVRHIDSQPNWIENDPTSRAYIKNRYPQKEINADYTLTGSDNGYTIFVNNGAGDVTIFIDKDASDMNKFEQCRIIQKGTGDVKVNSINQLQSGQRVFSTSTGNKIGGQYQQGVLTRQITGSGGGIVYGDFFLDVHVEGSATWNAQNI